MLSKKGSKSSIFVVVYNINLPIFTTRSFEISVLIHKNINYFCAKRANFAQDHTALIFLSIHVTVT